MSSKIPKTAIVAGGIAIAAASSKKKKTKRSGAHSAKSGSVRRGVRVSDNCSSVEVVSPDVFDNFTYGAYEELMAVDPSYSVFQITDALFGEVAPDCSAFPEEPESADVAELYAVIARMVTLYMSQDPRVEGKVGDRISEAQSVGFTDWYRSWRNYPSAQVPQAPSTVVSFSSDYSNYKIGEEWYEKVLVPFVATAKDQGRLGSVFEDFLESHMVAFGIDRVPMSELPLDNPTVQDFMRMLEASIKSASVES